MSFTGLASRYPDKQQMMSESLNLSRSVLQKTILTPCSGKWGTEVNKFAISSLENVTDDSFGLFLNTIHMRFVEALHSKAFILPSALFSIILDVNEEILTDVDLRQSLRANLPLVQTFHEQVFNTFFVEYVFTLGNKMLHFIAENLLQSYQHSSLLKSKVVVDNEERQVIHYAAGAIIRYFVRKARTVKKSGWWSRVHNAITKCIIEGDIVVSAAHSDRYWTEFCNRGGLIFVGKKFMTFLVSLVDVFYEVQNADGADGSLRHAVVLEKVMTSQVRLLWDEVIGSVLNEQDSLSFMRAVIQSFTSTYGKGIAKKHLNRIMTKPEAPVAFRPKIGGCKAAKSST